MTINADTKLAKILKENAAALEAIISLNPKFEKLRNPVLRKLMSGRTSIGMACRIGSISLEDFFKKLEPLGFNIESVTIEGRTEEIPKLPVFFNTVTPAQIIALDVRPLIDADEDPLALIMENIKKIRAGEVLKIINSFEPTPLLSLLKKQGFESHVDNVERDLVETYFFKTNNKEVEIEAPAKEEGDWDNYIQKYTGLLETIDVRALEMPGPMIAILEALKNLPIEKALFVYHKKIPLFLLPELKEKDFDFRIKEIGPGEVHLLIFKE